MPNHTGGDPSAKRKKWYLIGGIIAVLVIVGIVLGVTLSGKDDGPNPPEPPVPPVPPIPDNFNPYHVEEASIVDNLSTKSGILVTDNSSLSLSQRYTVFQETGLLRDDANLTFNTNTSTMSKGVNNAEISRIYFEFGQVDKSTVYMLLTDDTIKRWEPPADIVSMTPADHSLRLDMSEFKLQMNPFGFSIGSTYTDETLVSTIGETCYLMDKYMQVDFNLPSMRIFGLGERNREFALTEGAWTMWANGQTHPYDNGEGMKQTYGVHPFALVQANDNKDEFVGIWFRNTNAQTPLIQFNQTLGTSKLRYITTGGRIHAYFFMQGTAKEIIARYMTAIGKPRLPPFWSLGWQAASRAYTTLDKVKANVAAYSTAGIPLDGIWLDMPYMVDGQDFSVDSGTGGAFAGITDEITAWHTANQKVIPVLQAGLSDTRESKYVPLANDNNALLFEMAQTGPLKQKVNGSSVDDVYLDFFNEATMNIWATGLGDLYENLPFDGVWLDENEVTALCNGNSSDLGPMCTGTPVNMSRAMPVVGSSNDEVMYNTSWYMSYPQEKSNETSTYFLPFIPSLFYNFDNMTMALNATHPMSNYTQYDTHSLFGHMQAMTTYNAMFTANDSRLSAFANMSQFILSRSTFSGSGQFASHSTGDIMRTWEDMKYSVAGLMNFNMFGIPHTGADVCGSLDSSRHTEAEVQELCARWIQLSTFYPFARQHLDVENILEPYNLPTDGDVDYMAMAAASIKERYKYMEFLYQCLFSAYQDGNTCFDPMFFHYPDNEMAFDDIESTFMVGDALKVSPVMQAQGNDTHFDVFFPAGGWVNMTAANYSTQVVEEGSEMVSLPFPADTVHVHLRPGGLVQTVEDVSTVKTASDLAALPYTLVVNPDETGKASGKVFLRGSDSQADLDAGMYEHYELRLQGNSLIRQDLNGDSTTNLGRNVSKIVLANVNQPNAEYTTTNFACYLSQDPDSQGIMNMTFAVDKDVLTLTPENGQTLQLKNIQWINFGDDARDLNLCGGDPAAYSWKGGSSSIDLSGANATGILTSTTNPTLYPDLAVDFAALASGAVMVTWNYKEKPTGWKEPWAVSSQVLDINKTQSTTVVLSDYISLNTQAGDPIIAVSTKDGQKIFDLKGIILREYLNRILSTVYTTKDANYAGNGGRIMGLGDQVAKDLFLADGIYSLWSRDQPSPIQDGKLPGKNLYGVHPFYMGKATDNTWFGVYTNLAQAQDWWLTNDATAATTDVQTWATGGIGEMYFMFAQTPDEVTKMYHSAIVGSPVLTPRWALGWHHCRWGYNSTQDLKDIVSNYTKYNLPLDTQWTDIDYMHDYENFEDEQTRFGDLPEFIDTLHSQNQHFIPIIDAGLAKRSDYDGYTSGVEQGVFIRSATNHSEPFVGQVWPGDAVFPDFMAEQTPAWWQGLVDVFHKNVSFDGLWLDMNEVANFCNGVCYPDQHLDDSQVYKLPYVPTGRNIETKSINLDAVHMPAEGGEVAELDAHSTFSTLQTKATHGWFQQNGMRTMIIARSAFAGQGNHASRWLGDNFSDEQMMGFSVTGVMLSNIMGITLVGSDICGFLGNTNKDLCARWHHVGAFYPFSRNHNDINGIPQEPWVWNDEFYEGVVDYTAIMQHAIWTKYSLIPYYYSQLFAISMGLEATLFKPLFFEFPNDAGAYWDQEQNVMLGEALKLSIQSNKVEVESQTGDFYFPAGTWCDIMDAYAPCIVSTGQNETLGTKVYEYGLHLRENHIVPFQMASVIQPATSQDMVDQPIDLHINPMASAGTPGTFEATGFMFNDDGLSTDPTNMYNHHTFTFYWTGVEMTITVEQTVAATAGLVPEVCAGCVNMNDRMGSFIVHQSDNLSLTRNLTNIMATFTNGTTVQLGGQAGYDDQTKQLSYVVPEATPLNLPELQALVLK